MAEENGSFEYLPGLKVDNTSIDNTFTNSKNIPSTDFRKNSVDHHNNVNPSIIQPNIDEPTQKPSSASQNEPSTRRKSSLDDFELEIEGINLDDNIDTSVRIEINELLNL